MSKKILIIGGVAGGAGTAARLRRMDEDSEIIIFERGPYISYANCGLPYYIGGEIKSREVLLLQTPEKMEGRFNIHVRVNNEVMSIDKEKKEILVKDLMTKTEYTESYDVLVMSTGSTPIKPPITGIELDNIFTLWTIPDTDKIMKYIDEKAPKSAAVIGGGFIGLEMAENISSKGIDVKLIEMDNQVMQPLDFDMAQSIKTHLEQNNINVLLDCKVTSFEKDKEGRILISCSNDIKETVDMVILSIGVKPNGELAEKAGLKVNKRKGIIVDNNLKTSDPNIYALGDVIEVVDMVNKEKTMIPLAGPANKMARIVANNICGSKEEYAGSFGTSVVKIFDLTVSTVGHNEKQLNKAGKKLNEDYKVTIIHPASHASYYPGAFPLTLKLIFDLKGKVLGAQAIGYEGVDKRIDVIASTMYFGATVYDLEKLELGYAPPYSSAKDPVNMAGFSAENILSGVVDNILCSELAEYSKDEIIFLDIRLEAETDVGIIEGSVNIPIEELRDNLDKIDKNKLIIPYCGVGLRSYIACRLLTQHGFKKVRNLAGGLNSYKSYFYKSTNNVSERDNKEVVKMAENENIQEIEIDACGLQCPGPILKVYEKISTINNGDVLKVSATDPGFTVDAKAWSEKTGNTFIKGEKQDKKFVAWIKKGTDDTNTVNIPSVNNSSEGNSMVVFSGELDKAIASFIIANGALAMGRKVTMFFTFWGLNILRKKEKIKVKKDFMEKMFGFMMPRGTTKLGLSKMNMGGMGAIMMKKIMKKKNVETLDNLMKTAMENGARLVACTMSMDVMGIREEELIDGIDYGGVASYLAAASDSDINLFI